MHLSIHGPTNIDHPEMLIPYKASKLSIYYSICALTNNTNFTFLFQLRQVLRALIASAKALQSPNDQLTGGSCPQNGKI